MCVEGESKNSKAEVSHFLEHKVAHLTSEIVRLERELEKKEAALKSMDRLFEIISSTLEIYSKISFTDQVTRSEKERPVKWAKNR